MRCYLLGFNQAWANANMELCKQLISEADFCADAPHGIPIGERFTTFTIHEGDGRKVPNHLICIGHEHGGKVVIVKPVQSN